MTLAGDQGTERAGHLRAPGGQGVEVPLGTRGLAPTAGRQLGQGSQEARAAPSPWWAGVAASGNRQERIPEVRDGKLRGARLDWQPRCGG